MSDGGYSSERLVELSGPPTRQKRFHGRGALKNPSGRFEPIEMVAFMEDESDGEFTERLPTRIYHDASRSIITYNDSPDVGFSASINPYRGCEHGCIYCYARPTHEYLGLSCGLDFETKIYAKTDAPELLRKTLSSRSWQPQVIAMSGVTDPYQPVEKHLQLTRQCLEILAEFKNPVGIVTKNHLITRDIDILTRFAAFQGINVFISVTSLDEELAHKMEPRASSPTFRINAIRQLSQAGIPVAVLMGPIIPGLNDSEIDRILKQAAAAGARSAHYTLLRLPYGVKDLFQTWLDTHYPLKSRKIRHRIQDVRNGRLNDPEFDSRMSGTGEYAQSIARMFALCQKRHGLNQEMPRPSVDAFQREPSRQLSLF